MPNNKTTSEAKTGQIHYRVQTSPADYARAQNDKVKIVAPAWVREALQVLSNKIFLNRDQISFEAYDNDGKQQNILFCRNPLSLVELVSIARNEALNTDGKIQKKYYEALGFSDEVIRSLKDLVRHCVIVGKDQATHFGGYPLGSDVIEHTLPQYVFICDLSGIQFQQKENTGRLFLISKDEKQPLPTGLLDDIIYEKTVGEKRPTINDIKQKDRFVEAKFHGQSVYFDRKAYIAFVAQDVLLAGRALNVAAKDEKNNLNFKFLKYGAGFFADKFTQPIDYKAEEHGFPKGKNNRECFFEELIAAGLEDGLRNLFEEQKKLPPDQQKIKRIELPYYLKDYPKIKALCEEYKVEYARTTQDALAKSPEGFITATTNCGDPHALLGNEMGYHSVDAAIGENLASKGHIFSPVLNDKMKSEYLDLSRPTVNNKPEEKLQAIQKWFREEIKQVSVWNVFALQGAIASLEGAAEAEKLSVQILKLTAMEQRKTLDALAVEHKESKDLPQQIAEQKKLSMAFDLLSMSPTKEIDKDFSKPLEEYILKILSDTFLKDPILSQLESEAAQQQNPTVLHDVRLVLPDGTKRLCHLPSSASATLLCAISNRNIDTILKLFRERGHIFKQNALTQQTARFQIMAVLQDAFEDLTKLGSLEDKIKEIIAKNIPMKAPDYGPLAETKEQKGWQYFEFKDGKSTSIKQIDLSRRIKSLNIERSVNRLYDSKENIDYQAFHATTQTGVAEKWGNRSTQEDRVDAGEIKGFESLTEANRLATLEETVQSLEEIIESRGIGFNEGSALSSVVTCGEKIYTTNLGDSTAFFALIDEKGNVTVERLTEKLHEPTDPDEYKRINDAGGFVFHARVNGHIALSRAIGDNAENFVYDEKTKTHVRRKEDVMSHVPTIYTHTKVLKPNQRAFIINACDGLTEKIKGKKTSEDWIAALLSEQLKKNAHPQELAETLASAAIKSESGDNVSVLVTPFDSKDPTAKYTAVFDGHGGDQVSEELGHYFDKTLAHHVQLNLSKQPEPVSKKAREDKEPALSSRREDAPPSSGSASPASSDLKEPKKDSTSAAHANSNDLKKSAPVSISDKRADHSVPSSDLTPIDSDKPFKSEPTNFLSKNNLSAVQEKLKNEWNVSDVQNKNQDPYCEIVNKADPSQNFKMHAKRFSTEDHGPQSSKTFEAMLLAFYAVNDPKNPNSQLPRVTTTEDKIDAWKAAITKIAKHLGVEYTSAQLDFFVQMPSPIGTPTPEQSTSLRARPGSA